MQQCSLIIWVPSSHPEVPGARHWSNTLRTLGMYSILNKAGTVAEEREPHCLQLGNVPLQQLSIGQGLLSVRMDTLMRHSVRSVDDSKEVDLVAWL